MMPDCRPAKRSDESRDPRTAQFCDAGRRVVIGSHPPVTIGPAAGCRSPTSPLIGGLDRNRGSGNCASYSNYSANHPGESVRRVMTADLASVDSGSADGVRRTNWSRRYTGSVFGAA
jgi:hypothetical protein